MFNVVEGLDLEKHFYFCFGFLTHKKIMKQLFLAALFMLPIASLAQEEEDTAFQITHVRNLQEVLVKAENPSCNCFLIR